MSLIEDPVGSFLSVLYFRDLRYGHHEGSSHGKARF